MLAGAGIRYVLSQTAQVKQRRGYRRLRGFTAPAACPTATQPQPAPAPWDEPVCTTDRLACMKEDWKMVAVIVVGAALVYGTLVWLVPGGFVG